MAGRQLGMTLLELLVALTIFVLIAAAGYSGLQQGLSVQDGLQENQAYWQQLDAVMTLIQQDLDQSVDVAPRLPAWESMAFRGAADGRSGEQGEVFLFTRTGHTYFQSDQTSPYLRVAYRLDGETLYRVTRTRLNVAAVGEDPGSELLAGVSAIQVRYMSNARQWVPNWPQLINTQEPEGLPRAVELTLELNNDETYRRIFHVGAQ
jgi:general secretion pathway protein J